MSKEKDVEQLRQLSERELDGKAASLRQELFQTRALAAAGKLDKSSQLRLLRKNIARALTVRNERARTATK